jgi:hypothetical protein
MSKSYVGTDKRVYHGKAIKRRLRLEAEQDHWDKCFQSKSKGTGPRQRPGSMRKPR